MLYSGNSEDALHVQAIVGTLNGASNDVSLFAGGRMQTQCLRPENVSSSIGKG